jgi:hypothetical protein
MSDRPGWWTRPAALGLWGPGPSQGATGGRSRASCRDPSPHPAPGSPAPPDLMTGIAPILDTIREGPTGRPRRPPLRRAPSIMSVAAPSTPLPIADPTRLASQARRPARPRPSLPPNDRIDARVDASSEPTRRAHLRRTPTRRGRAKGSSHSETGSRLQGVKLGPPGQAPPGARPRHPTIPGTNPIPISQAIFLHRVAPNDRGAPPAHRPSATGAPTASVAPGAWPGKPEPPPGRSMRPGRPRRGCAPRRSEPNWSSPGPGSRTTCGDPAGRTGGAPTRN